MFTTFTLCPLAQGSRGRTRDTLFFVSREDPHPRVLAIRAKLTGMQEFTGRKKIRRAPNPVDTFEKMYMLFDGAA